MLAFVLGSGGSRGALQVGALQVLLEAGVQPDMVIGTSVGALNAAFFAADPTLVGIEKLSSIWLQMNEKDIYPGNSATALWRMMRGRPSFYENQTMHKLLQQHLPVTYFHELHLPCYAVATDIDSGEIVAFGDRPDDLLKDGLMSSTALAPAHPPWEVGDRRFIDGGFGAVLPVRQAIERGATTMIALNLTSPIQPRERGLNALEIMIHTSRLMMQQQMKIDLAFAAEHADLTVLDLESDPLISVADFSKTVERIERGRVAAAQAFDQSLMPPARRRVRSLAQV